MDLVWDLVRLGRATWLRGNHEQDLIDALQSSNQDESQHHLMLDTYKQLGEERAKQWLQRLLQLPSAYRADGWIATHAGFNSHGEPDLSIRDPFWESYDGRFGLVVIGHTPRPQVERVGRIVLIDTGAVYGGLLSAFCPETDAVVQVPGASCSTSFPRPQDEGRIPAVLAGEPSTC
jgi:serine/threonine protein phosphatase 1